MVKFDTKRRFYDIAKETQGTSLGTLLKSGDLSIESLLIILHNFGDIISCCDDKYTYRDIESIADDLLRNFIDTWSRIFLWKASPWSDTLISTNSLSILGEISTGSFNVLIAQFNNLKQQYWSEKAENIVKAIVNYLSNYIYFIELFNDADENAHSQLFSLIGSIFVHKYSILLSGGIMNNKYIIEE